MHPDGDEVLYVIAGTGRGDGRLDAGAAAPRRRRCLHRAEGRVASGSCRRAGDAAAHHAGSESASTGRSSRPGQERWMTGHGEPPGLPSGVPSALPSAPGRGPSSPPDRRSRGPRGQLAHARCVGARRPAAPAPALWSRRMPTDSAPLPVARALAALGCERFFVATTEEGSAAQGRALPALASRSGPCVGRSDRCRRCRRPGRART